MNPLLKLSKELPFISEVERFKKEVDSHRPFPKELKNKIFQKLRLDWNYNSNAIEGNSFTRGETVSLIMEGVTAKGKPLKDALDIKGHNDAIDFILSLVKDKRELSETDIRALHKLVLGEDYYNLAQTKEGHPTRKLMKTGNYKKEPNHVKTSTGEIHYYATPEETPIKMKELVQWYNNGASLPKINPIVLAALFHHRFVAIHPFDDGNGRMTRLLTNLILLKFDYPVSVIKKEDRNSYYSVLAQADNGEIVPLIEFISESVKKSFEITLKAIQGESIIEEDDLDKEIELFRKELGVKHKKNNSKADTNISVLVYEIVKPLSIRLNKFTDIFNVCSEILRWDNPTSVLRLNNNNFDTYESFSSQKQMLKNTINVNYSYSFDDYIYGDKKLIINMLITFKRLNYQISDGNTNKRITKLYSDEVNDEQFKKFIADIIRNIMNQIKK